MPPKIKPENLDEFDVDIEQALSNPDIETTRRRFIWTQVTRYGELPLSVLRRKFGAEETVPNKIRGDIAFWKKYGFQFDTAKTENAEDGRSRSIVDLSSAAWQAKEAKQKVRQLQKNIVAQAAMGLICGFKNYDPTQPDESPGDANPQDIYEQPGFEECYSRREIVSELVRPRGDSLAEQNAKRVLNKITQFHSEGNRLISLDAGTTSDSIAGYIKKIKLPAVRTALQFLTICTNSRSIFQELGDPKVNSKVIIIGGEQRGRSDAIAGRLSELFLQQAGLLRFGLSLIGATVIDTERMQCCSEDQVLSRLKAILLSNGSLRIVCVDDSKLLERPIWAAFPFVGICPEQIDLVLTNFPSCPQNFYEIVDSNRLEIIRKWNNFQLAIERIETYGVPVFIATPKSFSLPTNGRLLLGQWGRPQAPHEAAKLLGEWKHLLQDYA